MTRSELTATRKKAIAPTLKELSEAIRVPIADEALEEIATRIRTLKAQMDILACAAQDGSFLDRTLSTFTFDVVERIMELEHLVDNAYKEGIKARTQFAESA